MMRIFHLHKGPCKALLKLPLFLDANSNRSVSLDKISGPLQTSRAIIFASARAAERLLDTLKFVSLAHHLHLLPLFWLPASNSLSSFGLRSPSLLASTLSSRIRTHLDFLGLHVTNTLPKSNLIQITAHHGPIRRGTSHHLGPCAALVGRRGEFGLLALFASFHLQWSSSPPPVLLLVCVFM